MKRLLPLLVALLVLGAIPAAAQQSGSVTGQVLDSAGSGLPGVTVVADGDVLPTPRVAVTSANGSYRFPVLPPGTYVVTFELSGFETAKRQVRVLLQQTSVVDITLNLGTIEDEVEVIAAASLIDLGSTELKTSIDQDVIDQLPIGQEYRDLIKLIPGVQYSEDSVRGPSAGGSGQDNTYQFDGVNVGLPLFGTLSAEPSSHDIAQVSILKGGADATGFNRSGGFTVNTISRSGTNAYHGLLSYQVQTDGMTGDRDTGSDAEFERDRDWLVANLGGPLVADKLFFYASYYKPTTTRDNRSNNYGPVPDSESDRNEVFGKLTWSPNASLLVNGSYRDSDRQDTGFGVAGQSTAGTASTGADSALEIAIVEGSWVVNGNSYVNFKYTDFLSENSSRPDTQFNFPIFIDGSTGLNIGSLDTQGRLAVPQPLDGEDAFNSFIAPLIDQYGFLDNGVRTGGGVVGGASTISDQDFARENFDVSYDYLLGKHELHIGYQWSRDEEDLSRTSNGWGSITVPGGRTEFNGEQVFFEARFEQQSLLGSNGELIPAINSQFESQSIEINDVLKLNNWTFNFGVLMSNDKLYGQGLRENSSNVSGFEVAPTNRYLMHEDDFEDLLSPRFGATWSYNGRDTVYASWSKYYPAASSLPRAASWARNNRRSIRAFFDASGNLIGTDPVRSSSGKFFEEGIDPRSIDEYIIGHSRQLGSNWTAKAHVRYRYGDNFWEDTNNNARSRFEPPSDIPTEDYIPNLQDFRDEVGGSSYVIAQLDGAFTKYYEASFDAEWRGTNAYFKGSYVWSHYYGNFDQDNSTTSNDANTFVGSSFIADGAGRQLWNFREGNLRGDRRHQLKMFGYYNFKWDGSVGIFAIAQSGQPWEAWDVEVYRHLTGSSSDTSRFAEPAGSNTTSDHYQVDLNYTHHFKFAGRYDLELRGDVFNLFDKQTGYNIQNKRNSANFGTARSFFDPRRFQVALKFEF